MFNVKNAVEFQTEADENYTFVSSQTLTPEFPDTVTRQKPMTPLPLRSPREIERLRKHPFFKNTE